MSILSTAANITQLLSLFNGVDDSNFVIQQKYANQYEMNLAIEAFINSIPADYKVSELEREFILKYTGKGQQFKKEGSDVGSKGLFEFYTPHYLCELMVKLAYHYGYDNGPVLEPSCSVGRFFEYLSPDIKKVGFELDKTTSKIAQLAYPNATIHNLYFEQAFINNDRGRWNKAIIGKTPTWLKEYPFSLIIGNPPYGKHSNLYSGYFRKNYMQVEFFFLLKSIDLLKSGGILIFLTASNWLRNGNLYQDLKKELLEKADLIDAYRTPPVFEATKSPTDILIYRKK